MSSILVLWDIDHTLIENHGVNKETYALAFRLLTERAAEHRARRWRQGPTASSRCVLRARMSSCRTFATPGPWLRQ